MSTTSSTTTSTFRTRDYIAIAMLLYLTSSMVYYPNNYIIDNDLSAIIRFSFVIPKQGYHHHWNNNNESSTVQQHISMLDIDGDQISEAIALWRDHNSNIYHDEGMIEEWSLQIYDLSRLLSSSSFRHKLTQHSSSSTITAPFQPPVLFTSIVTGTVMNPHSKHQRNGINHEDIESHNMRFYPLAIATGHIIFPEKSTTIIEQHTEKKNTEDSGGTSNKKEEATLYYYCGIDWHDASTNCNTPCPSGSGCPDGQRCFAECRACSPSSSSSMNQNSNSGSGHNSFFNDNHDESNKRNVEYHTTIAGGWPSICTVWSQGQITMHTITAEKEETEGNDPTTKKKKTPPTASTSSKLQLRQLWNISLLLPDDNRESYYRANGTQPILEVEEVAITFVDPITSAMIFSSSSNEDKNTEHENHGIVLVTGIVTAFYYPIEEEQHDHNNNDGNPLHTMIATFVVAYHAYTGQRIWHATSSYEMEHLLFYPDSSRPDTGMKRNNTTKVIDPFILPRHGQIGSILRRRSGMISQHERKRIMDESTYDEYESLKQHGTISSIDCLEEYRRSIFTTVGTLPFQYDGSNQHSTKIIVTHFDHQGITPKQQHRDRKHLFHKQSWQTKTGKATKSKKQRTSHVEYGQPNVVVVHNAQGIHVHALRNGRSICHISLSDRTVYDDINHDGTIDSVQLINLDEFQRDNIRTDIEEELDDDGVIAQNKLYDMLQEQIDRHNNQTSGGMNDGGVSHVSRSKGIVNMDTVYGNDIVPCYALTVTSGLSLVLPTHIHIIPCYNNDMNHAPILLVNHPILSSSTTTKNIHLNNHERNYKDVIVALNDGMMGKMHGKYGTWIWNTKMVPNHVTWEDTSLVTLEQLYVHHEQSPDSPIIVVGQDTMMIRSSLSGRIVTTMTLPQTSTIQRPYIMDMNGDGTSDIVVVTNDAIWGYTIYVSTTTMNGSTSYRLLVGMTMFGLMLAYLRNRFGPRPGKRSTDL